jgi:methenyltetrahydrofolate cyclohydrolase
MSDRTLAGYIDAVAEASPAPGAGSVAAIAGSLGCALGEMVCEITLTSKRIDPHPVLAETMNRLRQLRILLVSLAAEDEQAYLGFRRAQALPKASEADKRERAIAIQATLATAAAVPLRTAECSCTAIELFANIAKWGSRYTFADIATAAHTLSASIQGANENVKVNIELMSDQELRNDLADRVLDVESRRSAALTGVLDTISSRK